MHVFVICENENEILFAGSVGEEKEIESWKKDLESSSSKEHADHPFISAKRKKEGVMSRAKKNLASKTASSPIGKKVMKALLNEETTTLINSLKRIVRKESGQKKADEIEKNIIKIAVKSYLLVENKTLKGEAFLVADKPLRDAFELMAKIFNGRHRVKSDKIAEACDRVVEHFKKAEEVITNLLAPHLKAKNMIRITQTFSAIANRDFLSKVYQDDELEPDLENLIDAMEYYTQFHFHKN